MATAELPPAAALLLLVSLRCAFARSNDQSNTGKKRACHLDCLLAFSFFAAIGSFLQVQSQDVGSQILHRHGPRPRLSRIRQPVTTVEKGHRRVGRSMDGYGRSAWVVLTARGWWQGHGTLGGPRSAAIQ
ncbi:uncharacterized protein LY79DRAFT_278089 [Colletotrichum navitas]|uniref:Uncharacterized protein n=1 Tax=Colletotrichum navitas TaxID=681940 RepID=A0AAD8PUT5_9PEZI|nr:uncharacterized protein LY79DRAFT_278089 [Colletotrichum navitas]KAK1585065.1 hypothetical protein LY79DRAFT_278089 [Colletotrichum navitas]